ncbi:MAG: hypothetical protein MJE66_06275 [Proteobacteria bacterium]|nr:hypothetical protein [Pseudomonadota bacterium]
MHDEARSDQESEPAPNRRLTKAYVGCVLVLQILWLWHVVSRDMSGLETAPPPYGMPVPSFLGLIFGGLGSALAAVLTLLALDVLRRRDLIQAYALAVYAAVTLVATGVFAWQMEVSVFRMARVLSGELEIPEPPLPASAPSEAECLRYIQHVNAVVARERGIELDPDAEMVRGCRATRRREELECYLAADSIAGLTECGEQGGSPPDPDPG